MAWYAKLYLLAGAFSSYLKARMDVHSMLVSHTDILKIRAVRSHKFNRIVVYSPQVIENYQLKSGEGLSVFFVYIWFAGDLCNLFGATLAGLLPTIIILAIYVSCPTYFPNTYADRP